MKILIAGLSVRAMVESAVHSGYPVVALDAFGDQDLQSLAESRSLHHDFGTRYNMRSLYKASRLLDFDALAYTSNLENHPDTLQRIAGKRPIIGNPPETVRSVRCWETLSAGLRRAGFSIPDTIFPDEDRDADTRRRWIVKPVKSGGGHGVKYLRVPASSDNDHILQEFLPGKPCSASFVANGTECVLIGVTEQLVGVGLFGAKHFRYCGNVLPLSDCLAARHSSSILEQLRELATFLTSRYGLRGVNGIDFILNDDRVCLIEVNPRYSASMELIEEAYMLPVFHVHAQAVLHGRLPEFRLESVLSPHQYLGKAILFASRNAVAPECKGWLDRAVRDIPASGERLRTGNPICTILANGTTYEDTIAGLSTQAELLKEEIYGKADFDPRNRTLHQTRNRHLHGEGRDGLSRSSQRD